MPAQKGRLFLLKVGDAASPEIFTTLAGLRVTSFVINNTPVDVTTKDSSSWRQLLEGGGIQSMSLSGSGVFTDAASEELVRAAAFAQTIDAYQIVMPNGDILEAQFLITSYERAGDFDAEETFAISLESSSVPGFTVA